MRIKDLKDQLKIGLRLADAIIETIICLESIENPANQKEIYKQKKYLAGVRREIQDFIMFVDSELRAVQ